MIHPVICNPIISLIVGVLEPVGWRAGGPSYPSGAILHFDGQVFKSHALPIGVGKITIFDGIATASQIDEAK